ncbi:hypothetical protein AM493_18815 [Flavobacterium akiainvivens]|uniref:Carbohydrate-binding protein SusD n=1 Tax=Flavobacterium akiainvivens TaxID=1202724 RepID=A0A0M8MK71_9FLAO|nr:RagB/SusD family nutrient uptake outer membrane protein [Flavobacterium akiainvivens]KOS07881.1 hypothetical protein AM493_18815 [Flavobacterium akiainvivens]SFQ28057.1 Starch-binding associating with outer membrane [Flavobacterium akiainvivens]
MKNKFRILYFVLASLAFTSCEDAIDITQPSELSPEDTYENVADLELGLIGVYGAVPGESDIYFTSLFTDEASIGANNGGQGTGGDLAFLLNNNTGDPATIWVSYYSLINAANRLIVGADFVEVEAGSDDEADKNDILAQAHALRAYGHLKLMSYFCPDMADDSALGVIAIDFVPESTAQLPRATAGEVWALVLSDLDFATANITPIGQPAGGLNYINQYTLLAMRARIAAFREQYAQAKEYVDQLDAIPQFILPASAAYLGMFLDTNSINSEAIWQLERIPAAGTTTGNFYQYWASVNNTVSGSPFFEVGRDLFNQYLPGDVRRFLVVDESAIVAPNYSELSYSDYLVQDVLPVGKYKLTEGANLNGDLQLFRFSEMVLIRAEYYASVNDYANVAAQVNLVRTARATTTLAAPTTSEGAWGMVLDERRREFAFEGHRYIDIKRLGVKAGKSVSRDPQDCSFNNACTLPNTDYRWTMPIPFEESVANPGIVQNPGYSN